MGNFIRNRLKTLFTSFHHILHQGAQCIDILHHIQIELVLLFFYLEFIRFQGNVLTADHAQTVFYF
jgi:hypothetical protein